MPYIDQKIRKKYDKHLDNLPIFVTKGNLEYCIYKLMIKYKNEKQWCYSDLHDCTYAAQHCADEFRRNFLNKREDEAREKNGEV